MAWLRVPRLRVPACVFMGCRREGLPRGRTGAASGAAGDAERRGGLSKRDQALPNASNQSANKQSNVVPGVVVKRCRRQARGADHAANRPRSRLRVPLPSGFSVRRSCRSKRPVASFPSWDPAIPDDAARCRRLAAVSFATKAERIPGPGGRLIPDVSIVS